MLGTQSKLQNRYKLKTSLTSKDDFFCQDVLVNENIEKDGIMRLQQRRAGVNFSKLCNRQELPNLSPPFSPFQQRQG